MIGFTWVPTNDLERAIAFYDALFADLGAQHAATNERLTSWSTGSSMFGVITPINGEPATIGNGNTVGLMIPSTEMIDALYAKALAHGATDEGEPGPRWYGYAAYLRDPDGNKLCLFNMG